MTSGGIIADFVGKAVRFSIEHLDIWEYLEDLVSQLEIKFPEFGIGIAPDLKCEPSETPRAGRGSGGDAAEGGRAAAGGRPQHNYYF